MIADQRLFLTADEKRVVPEGDPDAAFLFAAEGSEISDADAEKFGLSPAAKAEPEGKQAAAADNKQAAPPANKARSSRPPRSN